MLHDTSTPDATLNPALEPPIVLTRSQQIADLIRATAQAHGSSYNEVLGLARLRTIAQARRACIAAVHVRWPELSYPRLGRIFNRDHTTIMHALERAGVYVPGYRIARNREIRAAEAVARFLRRLGRKLERLS